MQKVIVNACLLLVLLCCSLAFAEEQIEQESIELVDLSVYEDKLAVEPVWSHKLGVGYGMRYLRLVPAHDQQVVYGVDWRGEIFAFDKQQGEIKWQTKTPSKITGGLTFSQQMVVMGGGDGSVHALNADDGTLLWSSKVSSEVLSRPLVDGNIVVVHVNDGRVMGLNAKTGKPLWTYQYKVPALTLRGASSPVSGDNNRVIVGLANGKLVALDLRNGSLLWEQAIAIPKGRSELQRMVDVDADPIVIAGTIYTVAYQGRIAAVDVRSGRILWTRDMSSFAGLTGDKSYLYVSDAEGNVHGIDRYSGAMLWKQDKLQGFSVTRPTLHQGYLLVGTSDGYLYWLSTQDGAIVSRSLVAGIAARLKGMEWDLWEDYTESGLPNFFEEDTGLNVAPIAVDDELIISADNQGRVTAFSF